jgi:hypothetical protein
MAVDSTVVGTMVVASASAWDILGTTGILMDTTGIAGGNRANMSSAALKL